MANLYFMVLESDNEVPFTSNSSCDNYCDDNDDDDDKSSIMSKLLLKYKSLFSKKKHYKHELTSLTKKFKNFKNKFSNLVKSNDKLASDLKNLNSLEDQLKKASDENYKLSKEVLELKNSISKFKRGKETLDSLLDSQKFHGDTHGIGYKNGMNPSSSSHINFVKAHDYMASTSKINETQAFKAKRSHVSNNKKMSYKTQPPLIQRGKAQTRVP